MTTELQEGSESGSGGIALEDPPEQLGQPYHLVAQNQEQLAAAHGGMLAWARNAQDLVEGEIEGEQANLEAAIAANFKTAPFENRINRLARRKIFYHKLEEALLAGFVLVPNFPMNTFAVRTKAKHPHGRQRDGLGHGHQQPQLADVGEGEYRNPVPLLETSTETRAKLGDPTKTYEQVVSWPSDWQEEIDFPLAIARPELMQRTASTMAKKLFDEIGVAVDSNWSTRGDPILLGRIRNPRPGRPSVTFFLGWYFDPSRL